MSTASDTGDSAAGPLSVAKIMLASLVFFLFYLTVAYSILTGASYVVPTRVIGAASLTPGQVISGAATLTSGTILALVAIPRRRHNVNDSPADRQKYAWRFAVVKYSCWLIAAYLAAYLVAGLAQSVYLTKRFPGGTAGAQVPLVWNYLQTILSYVAALLLPFIAVCGFAGSPQKVRRLSLRRAIALGYVPLIIVGASSLATVGPDLASLIYGSTSGIDLLMFPMPGIPQVTLIEFWAVHRLLGIPAAGAVSALLGFLLSLTER